MVIPGTPFPFRATLQGLMIGPGPEMSLSLTNVILPDVMQRPGGRSARAPIQGPRAALFSVLRLSVSRADHRRPRPRAANSPRPPLLRPGV